MSKKDKLIERFKSIPSDFTFDDIVKLLGYFGFILANNDGSKRAFINPQTKQVIYCHEPHPGNIMKKYMLRDIKEKLEEGGHL